MLRLLIVDDEFHIREGLRRLVVQTGLPIEVAAVAEDGETAIRLFEEQKPDIVLLDINLPDRSGLEVARRIREEDETIPLLFLTGYESMAYIREAIGLGAIDYLLKPVEREELAKGLRRAQDSVARRRREAEGQEREHSRHRSIAREYALLDLLLQRRPILDALGDINTGRTGLLPGVSCAVVCCDLDIMPVHVEEGGGKQLYGYAFGKLVIEAASSVAGTLGAAVASDRVAVVLGNASSASIAEVVVQIRSALKSYLGVSATMGISRVVGDVHRLPEAYREAVHAAEYKGWIGNGQIIPYELVRTTDIAQRTLLEKELLLISEIRAGNDGAVNAILREWTAQLEQLPCKQVKMMATQLVLFVMRILESQGARPREQGEVCQDPLLALSRMNSFHEIIHFVTDYFLKVGRWIREAGETTVPRMFEQAKAWIREHLHEDPSLNTLAKHLHLSPKYLSSRFKQVTGESFGDFLTRARFERARELLLDPGRKVGEIAEAVGFGDTNYFSIAFKKQTGYTPTEFRKRSL
ncbi:response regulator [Cohnella boryungensis]|uniref:Response regulator n=1 Tax=Cohnella boryungensis TaxID=768479 RepID=A0ABV8SDZ3_9BACL